jgi:hypothetical protein
MFNHDINPEEGGGGELRNFEFRLIINMVDSPKII